MTKLRKLVLAFCLAILSCKGHPPVPTTPTSPVPGVPSVPSFQSPITVYAVGDIADCYTPDPRFGHQQVSELLSSFGLNGNDRLFLALGDLAYPDGTPLQFAECYGKYFGAFRSSTRPTPGNHEYHTRGLGYFSYFGAIAGPVGLGYYSWNPPGDFWHVVSGNSNLSGPAQDAYLSWLEADLKANSDRPCTVAFWHHPRFSSGINGNSNEVSEEFSLLYKYGVEVLLAGHDHEYESFSPQTPEAMFNERGVREFVVGTGGAGLRHEVSRQANSRLFANDAYGVLELTLEKGTYHWRFVKTGGSSIDAGSASCHSVQ